MSKANGFIRIEREFWHSPEVLALSLPAKIALVEFHYCYKGRNNGDLCLPYARLAELHRLTSRTIARAIRELKVAGLIETTVSGSFDHKAGARKGLGSKYRLTYLPGNTKYDPR